MEVSLVIIAGDSRSAESELSETNRTRRPDLLVYALTILSVTCHVRLPHISESYIQDSPHRGPRRGGRVGEEEVRDEWRSPCSPLKVEACRLTVRIDRVWFERGSIPGSVRARAAALGPATSAATNPNAQHAHF